MLALCPEALLAPVRVTAVLDFHNMYATGVEAVGVAPCAPSAAATFDCYHDIWAEFVPFFLVVLLSIGPGVDPFRHPRPYVRVRRVVLVCARVPVAVPFGCLCRRRRV
jgi:hypothetical protein